MILCLSCVVVFCTVYALILPAITLERKTVCGQEEHSHTEECYSSAGQLTCGKTEHTHTESCYADDKTSEDQSGEDSQQTPEQNQTEGQEQNQGQSQEQNQDQSQDQLQTSDDGNVAQNGENGDTAGTTADETAGVTGEYVLNDHKDNITYVKLTYREKGVEKEVPSGSGETAIQPDDSSMMIKVGFKGIPVTELKNSGGSFTYQLPDVFRIKNTTISDMKNNSDKVIGTITVSTDGKVVVKYNAEDLESLGENQTIDGEFFVSAQLKLSSVDPETNQTTVHTPKSDITVKLDPDYYERYGNVTVDKQFSEKDKNSEYIKYTITVTAGDDGCKNVYVVDQFTQNKNLVNYVGIDKNETPLTTTENAQNPYETITGNSSPVAGKIYLTNALTEQAIPDPITDSTAISEPGSFVWNIAKMEAGESRTLTYYVKLKENAIFSKNMNSTFISENLINKAKAYTRKDKELETHLKGEKEVTSNVRIGYNMTKAISDQTKNADGNYEIKYEIKFGVNSDSNYPIQKFEFRDYLDYSDIYTDPKMLPYISYDPDSVELHVEKAGVAEEVYFHDRLTISWANGNDSYQEDWTDTNRKPTRFKVSKLDDSPITIYPGDSYYVTYKITVKPEVYAAMQSDKVTIKNRYLAYVDNEQGGKKINQVWQPLDLNEYSWVQKTQPKVTDQSEKISMKDQNGTSDIYCYDSSGTIKKDSIATEFTVPKGSYQYIVKVNQTQGQFNVTGATLTDSLDKDVMKYVGYVKITAYDSSNNAVETKWVKIDNQTSFSLKLSQLGWKDNNHSYQFEYYAKPVDLSTIGETKVTNTFKLTDEVKKYGSDKTFKFDNVNSSVKVTLQGDYHLNVAKKAWYYEEPEENATTWQNGKLYWIIEVNGSAIKKDTEIKDAISWDNGLTDSFIHKNEASIAGIYKGNLGEIKGYSSFEEFETQNRGSDKQDIDSLFELSYEQDKDGFNNDNYNNLIFKAKEDITLGEDQTLYIIVRTEPQSLPDQYRKPYTYRNEIYKTEPGETQTKIGSADQKLYHGGEILKELGQVFTYDGAKVTTDSSIDGADKGDSGKICSDLLKDTGSGIYAAWAFKVNHGGELNSNYRVLEEIPEGMELAYIRIKWKGANATSVESSAIANLGSEWTEVENDTTNDNQQSQHTIYYVSNDKKQAMIQLGTFRADHIEDKGSVDVQVVCRVTDPKVLLGGEEKIFTNKVVLQSANGEDLATATADAKIKDTNLTKENGYSTTSSNESQKVTYTIVANSRGQKLLTAEGEKLTLVDALGEYLSFDSESLKAKNIKNGKQVEIQSSYNPKDKTIEIVIPDETPVEITYSVTVNIAPNKTVPLQNSVYWKSYSAKGGTTNKIEQFSYQLSAGGSSGTTLHPNLTIKKIDQDNTSNKLNGVEFEVSECELKDNQIQLKSETQKVKATITDGTCEITTKQFTMEFNTIYEVKETKAADGYKLDETPHYIMCVKQEEGRYPDEANAYIAYCEKKKDDTKYKVAYDTKNFFLEIYNEQKGIVVEKAFINDAAGNSRKPVSGTYKFGLYNNAGGSGSPLDTVSITYSPGDTEAKTAKFKNLDLNTTYYVFELDDKNQPIKDSSRVAIVNGMEYFTSYTTTKNGATESNSATNGDTVTVTNQSRVNKLPSTGSCGVLIYRLAGAILILFAVVFMLMKYKETKTRN